MLIDSNGKKLVAFIILLLSVISCRQEKFIFYPKKLSQNYKFSFDQTFTEFNISVDKKTKLNCLLFKADTSKGLIFYLHGNGHALDFWGNSAKLYVSNNYDFFVFDYRGFGKSNGRISSQKELYNDAQIIYDSLKRYYNEKTIIIIGYSIGTGIAAKLASINHPKWLILKAPYYNLKDLIRQYVKAVPIRFLKYKLETNLYIQHVECPITIFHGSNDHVIHPAASYKLKQLFKEKDTLIILKGINHNSIDDDVVYREDLKKILNSSGENRTALK